MAATVNHGYSDLASRLTAAADGIVNSAASGLERDLREAAGIVRTSAPSHASTMTIAYMVGELNRIANGTNDPLTREQIRRLLGGA
jgi:hypothetical protein